MESIKSKLANKKFQKGRKETTEWQAFGEELTKFFKRNCYWVLWRYPKQKVYEAYRECQTRKIASINYFLGILKK